MCELAARRSPCELRDVATDPASGSRIAGHTRDPGPGGLSDVT
jgi:hypothetical protein